ncbi:MAG: M50 family metallopeptidase [Dehalococcoidia bacterium]|nr:M50 family metallopeptidase [Dehalococcoidia bacterium]
MKRKDLLWFLLYPVYQTISTIRHEGSHALAAMAEGADITEFVFWPSFPGGKFYFGYVSWEGSMTWFTTAAPYFCDLLIFFVALLIILEAKPRRRWLWINILIIGMLTPLLNSAYNYFRGLATGQNDIGELLSVLDPTAVHLYFVLAFLFYAWGLYHCYFRKKTWHPK